MQLATWQLVLPPSPSLQQRDTVSSKVVLEFLCCFSFWFWRHLSLCVCVSARETWMCTRIWLEIPIPTRIQIRTLTLSRGGGEEVSVGYVRVVRL